MQRSFPTGPYRNEDLRVAAHWGRTTQIDRGVACGDGTGLGGRHATGYSSPIVTLLKLQAPPRSRTRSRELFVDNSYHTGNKLRSHSCIVTKYARRRTANSYITPRAGGWYQLTPGVNFLITSSPILAS